MIQSIRFSNYRAFRSMEMHNVQPVTLISGRNNIGKSSILEGVFFFLGHRDPLIFSTLRRFRGLPTMVDSPRLWETEFNCMNSAIPGCISVMFEGAEQMSSLEFSRDDTFVIPPDADSTVVPLRTSGAATPDSYALKYVFSEDNEIQVSHCTVSGNGVPRLYSSTAASILPRSRFVNSAQLYSVSDELLAEELGRMELADRKEQVLNALRIVDPTVDDITPIVQPEGVQIYVKSGTKRLPIRLAGDGLNRVLYLILALSENPDTIVLIDEIETGFHYTMYPRLWEVVAKTAAISNCQVIATTHSYECISGASVGIQKAGRSDDFGYFRLGYDRNKGECAYQFSDDLLRTAIDMEVEVR
ncbi:MAG: ATP-binding protein [Clostridia bacterium]|nr:ATP-binding protein [Clostridia bacterium]